MGQLENLRSDFPDRIVHCGLVAPCKKSPGFAPEIVLNPAFGRYPEDLDPFDEWHPIYSQKAIEQSGGEEDLRTMICGECGDIHVAQELDRSVYGEPSAGVVPCEYGCS